MEPGGGTSGMKPVDVDLERVEQHDTDSSELSVSTASNTTIPHLKSTNAERALNEDERRKSKEARKAKREAREKKKEQQRLEEKKQRKEERKLKREARRKRREARKKKEEAKAINASSSELSSSSEDGGDDESYQVIKDRRKDKKGKSKDDDNNKYATVSFNYSSMSMTSHDHESFINVAMGKLLISMGLTLPSGST
jgi:hypothetical protein